MKNKNLQIANVALNLIGAGLLVSSFFVKDNSKAVKRRWTAVGVLGVAWGLRIVDAKMKISK